MSEPIAPNPVASVGRNIPYARVWTAHKELILPADLMDELFARGFVPGLSDPEMKTAPLNETGLADARFTVGSPGFRVVSLSSSRGSGCLLSVAESDIADRPDDLLARRTVPRPNFVFELIGGGQSNSDRNLCENIAEVLMLLTDGLVQIGGLGTKGNRPKLYASAWLGTIKKFS